MTLLLFTTIMLYAQNDSIVPIQITCNVIDAKTKKPIEYASVKLINNDYKKSKFTNLDGKCSFDSLQKNIYTLSVSYTGYSKLVIQNIALVKSKILNIELGGDSHIIYCPSSAPIIKKTEPTHDNFNSKQIMRMPY